MQDHDKPGDLEHFGQLRAAAKSRDRAVVQGRTIHPVTTPFGAVTPELSKDRRTGSDIATVSTGPGLGTQPPRVLNQDFMNNPGWGEEGVHPLYDATFADAAGRHSFPREGAAMMAAIRAAHADYAARLGTRR